MDKILGLNCDICGIGCREKDGRMRLFTGGYVDRTRGLGVMSHECQGCCGAIICQACLDQVKPNCPDVDEDYAGGIKDWTCEDCENQNAAVRGPGGPVDLIMRGYDFAEKAIARATKK
jgi:hypothetical protein